MFKKILLPAIFIFFFLFQPNLVSAQSVTPTNTPQVPTADQPYDVADELSPWEQFWAAISSFFNSLFGITSYVSKDYNVPTTDTSKNTTDYTRSDKDYGSRVTPESIKMYRKGVWFNEVLSNKYPNNVVSKATPPTCPEIKITDIVYVYYQQNQKILYQRGQDNKAIDYDSGLIDKYKIVLEYPISCYTEAYDNIQDVPQGVFQGQENSAASTSTQLNDSLRTVISNNSQGETAPDNNDTTQKTEALVKDSDKQEGTMLKSIIPDEGHDELVCGDTDAESRQFLRNSFKDWITPYKWHKSANDDGTNTPPSRSDENGNNSSNCAQSGHGRGMSQYGAYGMALSEHKYQDILYSYYGDSSMGVSLGKIDSSKDTITVALIETEEGSPCATLANQYPQRFVLSKGKPYCTRSSKICSGINNEAHNTFCYPTITLSIDDYLKGLGEMPASWPIEAHKAQSVAARTYAYARTNNLKDDIKNCSYDQVFRCKKLLNSINDNTNQAVATDATSNEILTKNGQVFSTEYSSCHGKASLTPPFFDGTAFERLAKAPVLASDGVCISAPLNNAPTASVINGLYTFDGAVHGARIKEDYDIGTIDAGKWLATYSGSCQLDTRVFPALDLLVKAANSDSNTVKFNSCYRSVALQQKLWEKALIKHGSEAEAAKWTARPGTSPHHTGRAIDFADSSGRLDSNSALYIWLLQNGSKYGFYNYKLEPWHWEYNP